MTLAIFRESPEGDRIGMTALGHSGYAEQGNDIVCAGISAIVLTACLGISRLPKAPTAVFQSGVCMRARLTDTSDPMERRVCDAILRTAFLGLCEIANRYPDNLRVFVSGTGKRRWIIPRY